MTKNAITTNSTNLVAVKESVGGLPSGSYKIILAGKAEIESLKADLMKVYYNNSGKNDGWASAVCGYHKIANLLVGGDLGKLKDAIDNKTEYEIKVEVKLPSDMAILAAESKGLARGQDGYPRKTTRIFLA